jgi:hypothetical protein
MILGDEYKQGYKHNAKNSAQEESGCLVMVRRLVSYRSLGVIMCSESISVFHLFYGLK